MFITIYKVHDYNAHDDVGFWIDPDGVRLGIAGEKGGYWIEDFDAFSRGIVQAVAEVQDSLQNKRELEDHNQAILQQIADLKTQLK